jgi:hypothetical protein
MIANAIKNLLRWLLRGAHLSHPEQSSPLQMVLQLCGSMSSLLSLLRSQPERLGLFIGTSCSNSQLVSIF